MKPRSVRVRPLLLLVVAHPFELFDIFCGLGVFELPYELGCGSHHTSDVYRCPQCASQETHSYQKSLLDHRPFAYDITAALW